MKKFGTPNGAGPGNENENVGLPADGTPPVPRSAVEVLPLALALDFPADLEPPEVFFLFFFFFVVGFLAFGCFTPGCLRDDGGCFLAEPDGFGGLEAVVVPVDVVVVVGIETVPVELVVPAEPVVPVADVASVPEPGAAHDSVTSRTGSFTGSEMEDSGVPAGTFTVKDSFPPPATVTVTTHESA